MQTQQQLIDQARATAQAAAKLVEENPQVAPVQVIVPTPRATPGPAAGAGAGGPGQ